MRANISVRLTAGVVIAASVLADGQGKEFKSSSATVPIKITILGSGRGPRPNPIRYGISILVEAEGEKLTFESVWKNRAVPAVVRPKTSFSDIFRYAN